MRLQKIGLGASHTRLNRFLAIARVLALLSLARLVSATVPEHGHGNSYGLRDVTRRGRAERLIRG
jgi:hypothetical protein